MKLSINIEPDEVVGVHMYDAVVTGHKIINVKFKSIRIMFDNYNCYIKYNNRI